MDLIQIIILFVVITFSMVVHELMHGLVSYYLGDDTAKLSGRLTLNPAKHIDPVMTLLVPVLLFISGGPIFGGAKPVPINTRKVKGGEYGLALVALAGPLSNLVIAFLSFGIMVLFGEGSYILSLACFLAVRVNLGFMIFNLLPIPPLDGSRIVYAIAPEFVKDFMNKVERYGFIVVFALILLFSVPLGNFIISAQDFFIEIFMAIFGV